MAPDRTLYRVLTALSLALLLGAAVAAALDAPARVWATAGLVALACFAASSHYRFRLLLERTQRSSEANAKQVRTALAAHEAAVRGAVEAAASSAHTDHERGLAALGETRTATTDTVNAARTDLARLADAIADARRELAGVESVLAAQIMEATQAGGWTPPQPRRDVPRGDG